MVLEEKAHAAERGVRGYAELLGHAATHDAHDHTAPAPDGVQLARAVTTALEQAGRAPEDVDVVFADGAGDPAGTRPRRRRSTASSATGWRGSR